MFDSSLTKLMDSVWEKVAYGDSSPCDSVDLKSIKHNLGQILVCIELRANLSMNQITKLMCYLAMHGEFSKIDQLVKEGFPISSRVFADAIRYGHAHKFNDLPVYMMFDNTQRPPYEVWNDVLKDYKWCPELMAARFGHGELLEKLSPHVVNTSFVSAAIYGEHVELAEKLAQKIYSPWENQSVIFAAYYTKNKYFMEKAINPDIEAMTRRLLLLGQIPTTSQQLVMNGNFRALLERERNFENPQLMYSGAVLTNNLKMLKWFKSIRLPFPTNDRRGYVHVNFSNFHKSDIKICTSPYILVEFAAIFANFKVFKWVAKNLRYQGPQWSLFDGAFPDNGWLRRSDRRINFEKYKYLFDIDAISEKDIFLRAIECGNLNQVKLYANDSVTISTLHMKKCRNPQVAKWVIENYNKNMVIGSNDNLPLETTILYYKYKKFKLQYIEAIMYKSERIDIAKWLISMEHTFSTNMLGERLQYFKHYAFVEFLFNNINIKMLPIKKNLPFWVAQIINRMPIVCICIHDYFPHVC